MQALFDMGWNSGHKKTPHGGVRLSISEYQN